ncbi:MAG: MarR family transcriptional regulator [Prevotellaceae bacterium]|jgi:DNA-binding IclR family transcriptional regulator|nr:MarR family transcriptional regulator [Prevotellaceae bacterium]
MSSEDQVLEAMRKAGKPLSAALIAELSGLDKKEVDKAMKSLKATGSIVSPQRCMWEPAK